MPAFYDTNPSLDDCWRAIILFGRNVASYKFALAKSLLELSGSANDLIRLQDLAEPFSRHLIEHLKLSDKQTTSPTSRFLDTCRRFNSGDLDEDKLIDATAQLGFVNVIDAFHVVNQSELPVRFFVDERSENRGIRLTDEFFRLCGSDQATNLPGEVEARWRLVETAWELDISRNLVMIDHDPLRHRLVARTKARRVDVTSCRDALNGYQKGQCFYCFDAISIGAPVALLADIDHFFPHLLKEHRFEFNLDGVWNLVLACRSCNRGEAGKFARVPSTRLLARLHRRNEYLISSHHPLRETLLQQTGSTEPVRRSFLQHRHQEATRFLVHTWEPEPRGLRAY
jgi:hypothetical protein